MSAPAGGVAWIAVDWGTSHVRAWAMDDDGGMIARASSDNGMSGLRPEAFEPALLALIEPWLEAGRCMRVVACGMVGARQGWVEAPYSTVPCRPLAAASCTSAPTTDPRIDVRIIPGLSQMTPPDVMRGEETQIAGYLAGDPAFEGKLCLPGTHSKWVDVQAGRVERFCTVMTGEIFALLTERSVLSHSIGPGWDEGAFEAAFRRTLEAPETLSTSLFGLRAASLVGEQAPGAARSALSGLLIGAEFAAMRPEGKVVIIGSSGLARVYASALELSGCTPVLTDGEKVTLVGLSAARAALEGAT